MVERGSNLLVVSRWELSGKGLKRDQKRARLTETSLDTAG